MARFFQSKYSGDQIEKALNTMLSPTSDNKFGVSSVNGQVGAVTNVGMLPVGAIYMSYVDISPATYIPNTTWERITDRVLIGAGNLYEAGSTGGSVRHNHIIGVENDTNAAALIQYNIIGGQHCILNRETNLAILGQPSFTPQTRMNISSGESYSGELRSAVTQVVGSTKNTNVLPPYLAVYIWRRIA